MSKIFSVNDLPVEVIRKKVIHFRLLIRENGALRLSAPWQATDEDIQAFLDRSSQWLKKQLSKIKEERLATRVSPIKNGKLFLWGEELQTIIKRVSTTEGLEKKLNTVYLYLPFGESDPDKLILNWYINETSEKLRPLIPAWTKKLNLPPVHCTVRVMKSRWGSCSANSNKIRINAWLAAKVPECLELVLAHELCHFFEKNHGDGFYKLLSQYLPDWKTREKILKE